MKKFAIKVLAVSLLFMGVGSVFQSVGAKMRSDDKALELVRMARIALGGDGALKQVTGMRITATTTETLEKDGQMEVRNGAASYVFDMNGRFKKSLRIGEGDGAAETKDIEVVLGKDKIDSVGGDTQGTGLVTVGEGDGKTKHIVITKVESADGVTKTEDGKVVFKDKDDVEHTIPADGERVMVFKSEDGKTVRMVNDEETVIDGNTSGGTWNSADGKVYTTSKVAMMHGKGGHGEMSRIALGLLLSPPAGADVSYKFIGEGEVDGFPSNIIGVELENTSFKLYLDRASNLPQMISYTAGGPMHVRVKQDGNETGEMKVMVVKGKDMVKVQPIEQTIRFSDFRAVDGVLLPFKWIESDNGKTRRTLDITNYEINPQGLADEFGGEKGVVIVKKSN
ncbi:MAG: hypothetical protein R2684_01530 [Pyrinomonadaceae bacterium]